MDLFNFIKQNVDILTVIGHYTNLKKTGSLYWKARCPFHHESTPSFTVSPHKNIFYCFGCHETGDVINFIEKIEHISALQAAQHLAQQYHLDIPQEISKTITPTLNKSHYQLCYAVAKWCNDMLSKNQQALAYVKKRNLSPATCAQFMIGFFPSGPRGVQQLIAHLSPQGFAAKDLVEAHILMQGKSGLYSPFEDRILFPIRDHLSQTCGFGGRIFLPEDTRAKYYNSMESNYFKKGKILFGFDLAKAEIQKQQAAILVEGYTDCIAMYQHGFKNVVATLGTACSPEHLQQIAKHAQKIYLLYDADPAGKQAIIRLTTSCWQLDLDLKVVTLPLGQDPASMLESNQSIASYIEQAQDIFAFFLSMKGGNFGQDTMKQKMTTLHELFELIAQVKDTFKQNILLMKTAETLQVSLDIIKNEYTNRYEHTENRPRKELKSSSSGTETHQEKLEEQILAAILYDSSLLTAKHETLLLATLSSKILSIIQKIITHKQQHQHVSIENIATLLSEQELIQAKQAMFNMDSSNLTVTFENLMVQFQKKYWKSLASHIRLKIIQAQQEKNTAEVQRLVDVFEELKIELCKNGRL